MVRINLIRPKNLADQHLIAEYDEILMLLGDIRKNPNLNIEKIPRNYCLGKGHILFFKNKLAYLKERHELLKKEMIQRGFRPKIMINMKEFKKELKNGWIPKEEDKQIIKNRLIKKIDLKPYFYRYYRKRMPKAFLINLIKNSR